MRQPDPSSASASSSTSYFKAPFNVETFRKTKKQPSSSAKPTTATTATPHGTSEDDIDSLRHHSVTKLEFAWTSLFHKYAAQHTSGEADEDDVIDLESWEIVEDHGRLKAMEIEYKAKKKRRLAAKQAKALVKANGDVKGKGKGKSKATEEDEGWEDASSDSNHDSDSLGEDALTSDSEDDMAIPSLPLRHSQSDPSLYRHHLSRLRIHTEAPVSSTFRLSRLRQTEELQDLRSFLQSEVSRRRPGSSTPAGEVSSEVGENDSVAERLANLPARLGNQFLDVAPGTDYDGSDDELSIMPSSPFRPIPRRSVASSPPQLTKTTQSSPHTSPPTSPLRRPRIPKPRPQRIFELTSSPSPEPACTVSPPTHNQPLLFLPEPLSRPSLPKPPSPKLPPPAKPPDKPPVKRRPKSTFAGIKVPMLKPKKEEVEENRSKALLSIPTVAIPKRVAPPKPSLPPAPPRSPSPSAPPSDPSPPVPRIPRRTSGPRKNSPVALPPALEASTSSTPDERAESEDPLCLQTSASSSRSAKVPMGRSKITLRVMASIDISDDEMLIQPSAPVLGKRRRTTYPPKPELEVVKEEEKPSILLLGTSKTVKHPKPTIPIPRPKFGLAVRFKPPEISSSPGSSRPPSPGASSSADSRDGSPTPKKPVASGSGAGYRRDLYGSSPVKRMKRLSVQSSGRRAGLEIDGEESDDPMLL